MLAVPASSACVLRLYLAGPFSQTPLLPRVFTQPIAEYARVSTCLCLFLPRAYRGVQRPHPAGAAAARAGLC